MAERYRHKGTKRRIEAVEYTGANGGEIENFVQLPVRECRGEYLIIVSRKVEVGEVVIRKMLDEWGVLDIDFDVISKANFIKNYKKRKEETK